MYQYQYNPYVIAVCEFLRKNSNRAWSSHRLARMFPQFDLATQTKSVYLANAFRDGPVFNCHRLQRGWYSYVEPGKPAPPVLIGLGEPEREQEATEPALVERCNPLPNAEISLLKEEVEKLRRDNDRLHVLMKNLILVNHQFTSTALEMLNGPD